MIAASPNWRSRSSSSARLPQCLASETPRFVAVTVLPVPPLGENTVTSRPCRCCGPLRRLPTWPAFRIAKTTLSVSCGRSRTSATSCSSASSSSSGEPFEASRTIGEQVLDLLRLVVGQREHRPRLLADAACQLAADRGRGRSLQHLDVADEDATGADSAQRADEVDVVARLER